MHLDYSPLLVSLLTEFLNLILFNPIEAYKKMQVIINNLHLYNIDLIFYLLCTEQ